MGQTAVTIGNYDGVHLGHAELIRRARAHAGPDGRVVVLAFDPHPKRVLRPDDEPARLTTFARRAELLREAGADEVHRLEPDRELLSLTPDEFMAHVHRSFAPAVLVEGADFHFGKGRAGHVEELRAIGERLGFGVDVVEPVGVDLFDQSIVTASSSLARWLLAHGRVADAARVLGRPHEVSGPVAPGDRRGRSIGFPTANVEPEQATPGAGVYAGVAVLPDGRERPAAIHIGERPTIGDGAPRVEAHILGLPTSFGWSLKPTPRSRSGLLRRDGADGETPSPWAPIDRLTETGWTLRLRLLHRLRDPVRFSSIDALTAQLGRDCARALDLLEHPAHRPEEIHA